MKKVVIGLMLALSAVFAVTITASAAEQTSQVSATNYSATGYFEGTFEGTVYADNGSRAPIFLELTQDGRQVEGYVEIGSGLYVDGGLCGSGYIPGGAQYSEGLVSRSNARQLNAEVAFKVSGLTVSVDLVGIASADGQELDTDARIDLPWLCGRDPVLTGTLYRTQ